MEHIEEVRHPDVRQFTLRRSEKTKMVERLRQNTFDPDLYTARGDDQTHTWFIDPWCLEQALVRLGEMQNAAEFNVSLQTGPYLGIDRGSSSETRLL